MFTRPRFLYSLLFVSVAILLAACGKSGSDGSTTANDPELASRGTIEVRARLVEIPEGAIFKRDLYHYATILKYEVLKVYRGEVPGKYIYVGHYDPWKPRDQAADQRVQNVGGHLQRFEAGQIHHMALDANIDEVYMGGIVNKYFGPDTGTLYWAAWTDLEH